MYNFPIFKDIKSIFMAIDLTFINIISMAKRPTVYEHNSLLNPISPQFTPILQTGPREVEILPGIGSTIMRTPYANNGFSQASKGAIVGHTHSKAG